ncbi:ATP/GTP-binding protein [Kitasatospora sp. NPDC101155]|uniref:ATP/GTP-binding protein n=1 Tax=Kitasatospora sp. NPDC101155 TaxID=3364097 RepID=UPI00381584E5
MITSIAGRLTVTLAKALRERHRKVTALAGCTRLADLLEAEPDLEALSYYPHLLAWELTQLPAGKSVVPVVLLDTTEDVGDRTHRDFERLLQHIVWLMPNVLFMASGRSRLQWADDALRGQLDYTGPAAWPGLTTRAVPAARTDAPATGSGAGGVRQVLIGDFSPEDSEDYLAHRLTDPDGAPLIPAPVRQAIAERSHGLPLFLDLAAQHYLALQRTGRAIEPADFAHDFPALVARTLQDLTGDERHALRAACLLDAFDLNLVTRAAGLAHESAAQRLVERPLVREDPLAPWPFHLHALVASTLRTADDRTDDRWTPADWEQAAARAHAALGDQWSARGAEGRRLLVACLRQGLRLARDHRLELGWLAQAAWAYTADSVWEPLDPPAAPGQAGTSLETPADALVETLSALGARQREHRTHTADRLTRVIDSRLLPEDLADMALYYRAKAHRDLGRATASREGMRHVAEGRSRLAPAARRGLAHLARLDGDFPTALATAQSLGWEGRQHRVLGDLWWVHAEMDQAAAAYAAARTDAEQHAVAGERATAQAQLAFVRAFTDPAVADDDLDLAAELLVGLDLRATTLTTGIAALVRDAGTPSDEILERADRLDTEIRTAGVRATQATLALARCFHHAVLDDDTGLATAVRDLDQLTRDRDYAYYTDIAAFMAGHPLQHPSPARWFDGPDAVRERWRALVTARQTHLGLRSGDQ